MGGCQEVRCEAPLRTLLITWAPGPLAVISQGSARRFVTVTYGCASTGQLGAGTVSNPGTARVRLRVCSVNAGHRLVDGKLNRAIGGCLWSGWGMGGGTGVGTAERLDAQAEDWLVSELTRIFSSPFLVVLEQEAGTKGCPYSGRRAAPQSARTRLLSAAHEDAGGRGGTRQPSLRGRCLPRPRGVCSGVWMQWPSRPGRSRGVSCSVSPAWQTRLRAQGRQV